MRSAKQAFLGLALVVGACGNNGPNATSSAATGEPMVIKEQVNIAAASGAEIIATGQVVEGSTRGGAPFCVGGTVKDVHGSGDPSLRLIVETITCPDGTLSLAFTPSQVQGNTQTGSWFVVGGEGAYEGMTGSGDQQVVYGPTEASPTDVTYRGTVRR